ncbi:ovomucoid-like isoform X2 [Heptranchias perlo]|uniref:ovomucoid-like isoform X2 n=1 Tax=Heptranchias perlo TaxID=212740 RepID=UPI00355AAD91
MKPFSAFALLSISLLCAVVGTSNLLMEIQPYCKEIPKKIPLCDQNYAPVCGTNGVTYGNECRLCAAVWATRVKIRIQKFGSC